MNISSHILALLTMLSLFTTACGLVDIRPDEIKQMTHIPKDRVSEGKKVLAQMMNAHGGKAQWLAHRTATFDLHDVWPSFIIRSLAMPWADHNKRMRMSVALNKDLWRIDFPEGTLKNTAWGIQQWMTYKVDTQGVVKFGKDENIWFWLPTVGYFFEAPFRIADAGIVAIAKPKKIGDNMYDRVFLSWGQAGPQKDVDQYIAWIDQKTHMLTYFEFTIRDYPGNSSGTVWYHDYKDVQGIKVPGSITAIGGPGKHDDILHNMIISNAQLGHTLDPKVLMPDPTKRAKKNDHGG